MKSGRVNFEDLVDAYSEEFGGAKGIAMAMHSLAFDSGVRAATRLKIFAKVDKAISDASRLYGDRAKLSQMSTEEIKSRLVTLLKEHDCIVPIPGVELVNSNEPEGKEGAPTTQESS